METMKIGKFIAQLRREQHMTQETLGEVLGVTNKTISRWETGSYLPTLEMMQLLSNTFHVSVDELLQGQRRTETGVDAAAIKVVPEEQSESSIEEKRWFWAKKWFRRHTPWGVVVGLLIIWDFLWGEMAASSLAIGLWPIGLLILFGVARSNMLLFIEEKVYPKQVTRRKMK